MHSIYLLLLTLFKLLLHTFTHLLVQIIHILHFRLRLDFSCFQFLHVSSLNILNKFITFFYLFLIVLCINLKLLLQTLYFQFLSFNFFIFDRNIVRCKITFSLFINDLDINCLSLNCWLFYHFSWRSYRGYWLFRWNDEPNFGRLLVYVYLRASIWISCFVLFLVFALFGFSLGIGVSLRRYNSLLVFTFHILIKFLKVNFD